MIRKIILNNVKKFGCQEFEMPDHLVIAGPNNSGKTTILQAIAAWSEIATQWRSNNPDLAREQDGSYPDTNLNVLSFRSIPLADFDHLWKDKDVKSPASISVHTDQWKIGFEILYKEGELVAARPAKDVEEDGLENYIEEPLIPIYIPPFPRLELKESLFDPEVIRAKLAAARGGDILRNLLVTVYRDPHKWTKLQETIRSFFGYELAAPSSGTEIYARYQHSKQGQLYELSSAASGFLQVLTVYTSLLHKDASVVLIDEPDAHLHILLQEKIYRDLREYAHRNAIQLVVATHSEQIINASEGGSLRVLTGAGELRNVTDKRRAIATLRLENTEISLALTEPGILYVEGKTDIHILREWARTVEHPLLSFLERPFWRPTAVEKDKERFPIKHFDAMCQLVPDFRGVELRDGDQAARSGSLPRGMQSLSWQRPDIESYLIHPKTIFRFVKNNRGADVARRVDDYMKQQLPPAVYDDPSKTPALLRETKGKTFLSELMQEAGIEIKESDYHQVAAVMKKEEIHPEVIEKIDEIAGCFGILQRAQTA